MLFSVNTKNISDKITCCLKKKKKKKKKNCHLILGLILTRKTSVLSGASSIQSINEGP